VLAEGGFDRVAAPDQVIGFDLIQIQQSLLHRLVRYAMPFIVWNIFHVNIPPPCSDLLEAESKVIKTLGQEMEGTNGDT
jgi:hypothetical protein